ncbi:MAG: hypothetical protein JWO36_4491 [Myxococcales bacterium]|nr:hypothetical protein [Myxococcales bacterium]
MTLPAIRVAVIEMRIAIALLGLFGCTTGSGESLTIYPLTTLFSGADPAGGGATYKVTIGAKGASGLTWTSTDPTVATVTGTDSLGTVVSLKEGAATITATSAAGSHQSLPLLVMSYAASDLAAGQAAYDMYSCAKSGCHDLGGPDITPSGIGKHTDPQLLATVTTGFNPEGGEVSIGAAMHSFPIAAGTPEYVGIVAYMRSLPPGIPKPDL